jgi:hypothetical protein
MRLRCVKTKGNDNVNWGVAWCKLEYNYSPQTYQELNRTVSATGVVSTGIDSFQTDDLNLTVSATGVASCDYDFLALRDTAYIDCADDDNFAAWGSPSPASTIPGEDAECSTEGPQKLTIYVDGSDPLWGLCYEIVGGSAPSVLEGLGTEQNYGPAPVYPPNGDAALFFGKLINFGAITYVDTGANSSIIEIRFSVLNPSKTYTITICGMRGGTGVAYDRWTEYKIIVGDNWTEEHSTGTIKGGTPTGETCTYRAGKNYSEGYVAKWSGIQPDSGGNIIISMTGVQNGGDAADKAYLSAMIITESALSVYQEFFRTVSATGVVTETDTHETSELNLTVSATGVVSCTDSLVASELNLTVSATGVVSCTDSLIASEANRTVSATGVVSCTDSHVLQVELDRTVSATGVVSGDDDLFGTIKELNLTVSATGVVSCTDSHYWQVELNRTVSATGVVTETDILIIDEISDDKIINGNFNDWTATDPDNWTVQEEAGSSVTEVGQGEGNGGSGSGYCNLYSSVGLPVRIEQVVPIVIGKKYSIEVLVDTIVTNGVRMEDYDASPEFSIQDYTTTGQKGLIITAAGDHIDLSFQAANLSTCDVTIDDVCVCPIVPADSVVSCSDEHFLGEKDRIVSATGAVSCVDSLIASEANRTVSATGAVTETDTCIFIELDRKGAGVASVSCIDNLVLSELNRTVSATGVVTETDNLVLSELNRTVSATGVVSCVDTQEMVETNLTVSATGVVTETDSHVLQVELDRTVSATGVVSCVDNIFGVIQELNLTVSATGVVTETDSHVLQVELNRTVSATGVVTETDLAINLETNRTVSATGVVTEADLAINLETNRTVSATGVVTETDLAINLETNRTVSATGVVTETDLAINLDSVLVQADGVVSCTDLSVGAVAVAAWFILRQSSV